MTGSILLKNMVKTANKPSLWFAPWFCKQTCDFGMCEVCRVSFSEHKTKSVFCEIPFRISTRLPVLAVRNDHYFNFKMTLLKHFRTQAGYIQFFNKSGTKVLPLSRYKWLLPSTNSEGFVRRWRYKGRDTTQEDSSSDSEEEVDLFFTEDTDLPGNYKDMKIHVKSLRADAIVSTGLDIARNRVDEIFFGSRLWLNGSKLLKKSRQLKEEDHVDVVTEYVGDDLRVKRVKILKIVPERTQKDKLVVWIRVWKSPFRVENEK